MLLTAKAWAEGGRAFCSYVALQLDKELNHPDEQVRKDCADEVALLTPVIKAFITDNAWTATSECLQVYGGHGYIAEWGMEQYVRDARINLIYEVPTQFNLWTCWVARSCKTTVQNCVSSARRYKLSLKKTAPMRRCLNSSHIG